MGLERISKNTALAFYREYEHLGNCGLGVWHFGLYNNDSLISVVSFGTVNFNPKRSKFALIVQNYNLRIIQLTRGGTRFDAPKGTPSRTISLALQEIKKDLGCALIVAYSDTKWNEIGTIYQASNFLYLGLTNPKGQANYIVGGKFLSGWSVRKKFGTRDLKKLRLIAGDVIRIPLTPKHMYVYPNANKVLNSKIKKDLAALSKPYPKRKDLNVGSMLKIRLAKTIK